MRRFGFCFLLFLVLLPPLLLRASAEESTSVSLGETTPEEYISFLESIPEEILELLPKELFSDQTQNVEGATRQISSFSFLLSACLKAIGAELGEILGLFASICGVLLLSAVCKSLHLSFGSQGLARAFSFCATLAILSILISQGYRTLRDLSGCFSTLGSITAALLPLLGVLYAVGGNLGAAASTTAGLSVYMTVMEEIIGKSVLPFCAICLSLSLIEALNRELRLGGLLSTLKKNYTTVLAFLMMLLLAMLSSQTVLSAGSDGLVMKSAKFAAGNLFPVVGGSVSELLRTVGAGVGYLRSTLGSCAILLLLLTLLPILIRLLLTRFTWQMCAALADLLGCDGEKKLLEEFASLGGYLLTALAVCSSVLLLSLTLLIRCASAIG